MQSGLPVARIEFLDEKMIDACNRFSKLNLDVAPTLFLEFHGSNSNIEAQGQIAGKKRHISFEENFEWIIFVIEETCKSFECLKFNYATDIDKRNELWKARHNVWYSVLAVKPGSKVSVTSPEKYLLLHYNNICLFYRVIVLMLVFRLVLYLV
jgi:D-lactate dehydrogenase (cytochrome)